MDEITYRPIGIIRSPYCDGKEAPLQGAFSGEVEATAEVFPEYVAGLKDLDGFSHVTLLYHFHLSEGYSLEVRTPADERPHGVFATRAPARPNSVGVTVVRLERIDGGTVHFRGPDMLDGTPLLDIKPYVPEFDSYPGSKAGWFDKSRAQRRLADDRFASKSPKARSRKPKN